MSNRHQELASPKQTALCCTKALATPEQTATGKEISNPLTADSLLKTISSASTLVSTGRRVSIVSTGSGVGVDTAYPRHGYAVASLMDTVYWLSE
ncbi:hypothetical protein Tco_0627349 [Tanacetum coccineum]|uniref:Uncharacterized protein n=1 Tax=Tanacetum coccineum TaxID=301880 RepID=A0ABQ4WM56_9ASTR